jgi:hypothetical protein
MGNGVGRWRSCRSAVSCWLGENAMMHPDELALAYKLVFGAVSVGAFYFFVRTLMALFAGE